MDFIVKHKIGKEQFRKTKKRLYEKVSSLCEQKAREYVPSPAEMETFPSTPFSTVSTTPRVVPMQSEHRTNTVPMQRQHDSSLQTTQSNVSPSDDVSMKDKGTASMDDSTTLPDSSKLLSNNSKLEEDNEGASELIVEDGLLDLIEQVAFSLTSLLLNCVVSVEVFRGGKLKRIFEMPINLHKTLPTEMLEISGGVIHPLSIMAARNSGLRHGTCFVSQTGHMLSKADISSDSIILSVGKHETPDISSLVQALVTIPHRTRFPIKYRPLSDPHSAHVAIATMDRCWFNMTRWCRNDCSGLWEPESLPAPPLLPLSEKVDTTFPLIRGGSEREQYVSQSLCIVEHSIPQMIDGVHASVFIGVGAVVHLDKGLKCANASADEKSAYSHKCVATEACWVRPPIGIVLVDRNTVPIFLGDVTLTFASTISIHATIEYLHPHANFTLLSFDPRLLGDSAVTSVRMGRELPATIGETMEFVGLTSSSAVVTQQCKVVKIERTSIPEANPPRFRAWNTETYTFDRIALCLGGVFLALETPEKGVWDKQSPPLIRMLWASFSVCQNSGDGRDICAGMPLHIAAEALEVLLARIDREIREVQKSLSTVVGEGLPRVASSAPVDHEQLTIGSFSQKRRDSDASVSQQASGKNYRNLMKQIKNIPPVQFLPSLGAEMSMIYLSSAIQGLGLTAQWAKTLESASIEGAGRFAVTVKKIIPGAPSLGILQEGDIILAMQGQPIASYRDIEMGVTYGSDSIVPSKAQVHEMPSSTGRKTPRDPSTPFSLTIFRDGEEMDVVTYPLLLDGIGTDRVVIWSGMLLQHANEPVEAKGFKPPYGARVYCSRWSYGSPAHKASWRACQWVVGINDQNVSDLDSFLEAIRFLRHGEDVRIKCIDLANRKRVYTLRMDLHYWPTAELRYDYRKTKFQRSLGIEMDMGSNWVLLLHQAHEM